MRHKVILTKHGRLRLKQRCGIIGKEADRHTQEVYKYGRKIEQTNGKMKDYLICVAKSRKGFRDIRLYKNNVYVFSDKVLITVLSVPQFCKRNKKQTEINIESA